MWFLSPVLAFALLTGCGAKDTPASTTTTTPPNSAPASSNVAELVLSWCVVAYSPAEARAAADGAVADGTLSADQVDFALAQYSTMAAASDQC